MAEEDAPPLVLELSDKHFPLESMAAKSRVLHGFPTIIIGLPEAFLPPMVIVQLGFRITHFKSGPSSL